MSEELKGRIFELSEIEVIGWALVQYANSLSPGSKYKSESARYVLRPDNFVTFSVHSKRANNLTVSLRGKVSEFEIQPELKLQRDQNGYCLFKLRKPEQLHAAASYIQRAAELFKRGRQRMPKTPRTVED
jgi:hypothetical protein